MELLDLSKHNKHQFSSFLSYEIVRNLEVKLKACNLNKFKRWYQFPLFQSNMN